MRLRRVKAGGGATRVELRAPQGWVPAAAAAAQIPSFDQDIADDVIALLALAPETRDRLAEAAGEVAPAADGTALLPFEPRSFRDFMLYEAHAVDAARGFVRRFMPAIAPAVAAYEAATRRTFPKLKPHALWHRQPIYYIGNHLTFATYGDDIAVPPYTRALDYELELGFVPVRCATLTRRLPKLPSAASSCSMTFRPAMCNSAR